MDPRARADSRADRRPHPRRCRGELALGALALLSLLAGAARAEAPAPDSAYEWRLPRGFPKPAVPKDNPMSDEKVILGRRLFFEPRLSVSRSYSCASCHDPSRSFSDGRPLALGATGEALPHNAMALVNVAYNISFGWTDARPRSLEAQMLKPLLNRHPIELGLAGRESALCAELGADPSYQRAFAASFPGESGGVTFDQLVKAIAAFERTLISGGSAFDRYVYAGEHTAITPEAKRGMALFYSAEVGCARCHSGFNFSGNYRDADGATGPASFATNGTTKRLMRVPTLRNVALTAPYMHDGRFATLAAVLEHYSAIGARTASGAPTDRRLPRAPLSSSERAALIAFLESLTDESFVKDNLASRTPP